MPGPSLQNFQVPRRGRTSSGKHNDQFESILRDINRAFRGIQTVDNRMLTFLRNINYQNQLLQARVENTRREADNANSSFNALNGTKLLYASYWGAESISNINTLRHDQVHGQITLIPNNSWSHIPVVRNAQDRLIPVENVSIATSEVKLSSQGNFNTISRPDNIYYSINKSPTDSWSHTWSAYPPASLGGNIGLEIEITVPEPMSPAINTLIVHPFPYWGCIAHRASILSAGGAWTDIPGWPAFGKPENTAWYFGSTNYANKFRIKMINQSTVIDEYLEEVKIVGSSNIDIGFTEFAQEGNAIFAFEAPSTEISYLRSFSADLSINTEQNVNQHDYIWFEIYKDADLNIKVYDSRSNTYPMLTTDSPIDVRIGGTPLNKLWVRVTMKRVHSTTPILRDIAISYT